MSLQIGFARQPISPKLDRPVFLAGFGQNRQAESVHDDLYVRALALVNGEQSSSQVVLVTLDLLGLLRQQWQEIEKRVNESAPGTYILGSCTHTHHGPDTIGLWGPDISTSGVDSDYLSWLKDQVVETILAALADVTDRTGYRKIQMEAVSVLVQGLAKNTRNPEIVDDELFCLQFSAQHTGRSQVIATLVDFPCHPEVLGEDNTQISADYPGYLCHEIENHTGAPCIFFAGGLGGMMTPNTEEHTFMAAEQMGRTLALAGLRSLEENEESRWDIDPAQLEPSRVEYSIPLSNPLFQMAMGTGMLPNVVDDQMEITTEANLLKIGPAWLAGVPGELLPKLGLALKDLMHESGAEQAAIIGLANDEQGYILPKEEYVYPENPFEPGEHYEETMSVGPEAGPQLLAALREMM